ncbi:MAG: SDR family NAD(P)-dependent oxidoreductase [Streptosporangiaceae bacterium]
MRLAGKSLLVTGGSQGIGRAVIAKAVKEGARVAFCDLDEVAGEDTRAKLSARGEVLFVPGDVTREADVGEVVAAARSAYGGVDVLVNNAGVNAYYDATEMSEADWDRVFAVDLKGAWLMCKHVLPLMRAAGGGSVVNIASIHARLTTRGMFPYAAAKSGVVGLTRSLALDYGPAGIRVNAICPGYIRTRLVDEALSQGPDPAGAERQAMAAHPLGRIGAPDEVANVVAFVASDEASFMTGSEVYVDGGLGARFAS